MIPQKMEKFLRDALPERTWQNRLRKEGDFAFMEFGPQDVDRLSRLGIQVDRLGPYLVVCMWDEGTPLEVGGYLVVDNLAMGRPSMGGIRMLPNVMPSTIFNLARGMTLKNAAADLPFGGGKAGIVAPAHTTPAEHTEIVRRFAHLIYRYRDIYLPGPDVGTNDEDMKTIAIENGLDSALSKTVDMGGNRIDKLGAAARGVVVAINTMLKEIGRMKVLPQFSGLEPPARRDMTVLIQGFGAVGTNVAAFLLDDNPDDAPKITGISDASGYLYNPDGLHVRELLLQQERHRVAALPYYENVLRDVHPCATKFSNYSNDLLREDAFCFVPAAPIARYLGVDADSGASMTVDKMGNWSMIVEGANTYSPDPARRAARARMERAVYWQKGVIIASDFLVNSGGVIYAAQEQLIKTPDHLRIPDEMLGNRKAVDQWLADHQQELAELAEKRRLAGQAWLERAITRNMKELVDRLIADPDLLPFEAAEQISVSRIASKESLRTVKDVMEPIATIRDNQTLKEAAAKLISIPQSLLAVISETDELVGVVTNWNIAQAASADSPGSTPITEIMTAEVITASPNDSILDVVQKLEHHEISAMPVVSDAGVIGIISSDVLARRTLYRLLQTVQ